MRLHKQFTIKNVEDIIDFYVNQEKNLFETSTQFNTTPGIIRRLLNRNNILLRKSSRCKNPIQLIESNSYQHFHECTMRKHIKRYLIQKHGHICSICKTEKWQNKPVPLICDHIDGKHDNKSISNFRLVCCNCDAQLPTYKSKNRGNGDAYNRNYMRTKVLNGSVA